MMHAIHEIPPILWMILVLVVVAEAQIKWEGVPSEMTNADGYFTMARYGHQMIASREPSVGYVFR